MKTWLIFGLLLVLTIISMLTSGLAQSLLHLVVFFGIMGYVFYAKPPKKE
ncbi:hypothetical protein [uncultured Shewanella sp.]|nr:hypothetical protein [uncultured Shewanella sp.]